MNYRIGFVSLGCPKALVDSERIITQLRAQGYELVSSYENAHLVIINTCGFIESAIQESLDTIQEAMVENGKVIVTGCLGKKPEMILERFPGLLHLSGPHAYEEVIAAVHAHLPPPKNPFTQLIPPEGIKLTPRHYAYLKISEGCNQKCTFCIIPSMRGKLQSYPMNEVLTQAEHLVKAGVKELLIISQDTSAYGVDQRYAPVAWKKESHPASFLSLCRLLGNLGVWVRLHYVYPYPHVDEVIPLMRDGLILPYLDIPLQHANHAILKAMKRPANAENTLNRIQHWRSICPDLTIRSTFIVGFPGETDEAFEELLSFLKEAKLDRVGCFPYSPVKGAAANTFEHQIDEAVKQERFHRFMETQAQISHERLRNKIGTIQEVLIDECHPDQLIARSKADAPEIDGCVYLPAHPNLKPGDLIKVKITHHDDYDLFGEF